MNLLEIIRVLCRHFIKSPTTNRGRVGVAICLKYTLLQLPRKVVEDSFGRIAEYLFVELLDHPSMAYHRHRYLLARNVTAAVLQALLQSSILTENAQINTTRYIVNDVLKNYPKVVSERREPSKRVLTGALTFLNQLLKQLGSAVSTLQDSCREALCQVIQHPSYTVQSHAAQCFRNFVLACPNQLIRSVDELLSRLSKSLDPAADSRHSKFAAGGLALGVAGMLHSANQKPVFGSVQLYSQVFSFATDLLKASATSELRLSAAQVQIAWTLLGGLMNLGPSFVKVHLNQLLLLWRNALPPPLTPENAAQRSQLELNFLCHVRESALSGLLAFLDACSSLVTTDGSRRIATMLQNTLHFLHNLPSASQTEDVNHRLVPALHLQDMTYMLRRRLLQCFSSLLQQKHIDLTDALSRSDLMNMSMRVFTSPNRSAPKNLEASLANSASNFEGVWEAGDNWAYGVTSLVRNLDIYYSDLRGFKRSKSAMLSTEDWDVALDEFVRLPALPALEHDAPILYRPGMETNDVELSSAPTGCVDNSIKLFSIVLPLQSMRVQEISLEQLATILSQPMQRDPGKKAAVQINAVLALLLALSIANNETAFSPGRIHMQTIGKLLAEVLQNGLADQDVSLRTICARGLGLGCNLGGTQFTNNQVKTLVELIVANRDPNVRAGCALALGSIHAEVGAMASSLHIKSIVGVLLSLCNDAHPVVHFWALRGLNQVAESAGLSFSAYATNTLGMMAQLYSSDTHNAESGSLVTSNLELEYSTTLCIAQSIDCIINVIGPDLQDMSKQRNMILSLIGYLKMEESVTVQYHTFVCIGHLSMYAPAHLQFSSYVLELQELLVSSEDLLSSIAKAGLGDLMKRNASEVARVASSKLNEDLWRRLDDDPDDLMLQAILRNWLQQTMLNDPGIWVDRCQTILSRTRARDVPRRAPTTTKITVSDLADEEVAGFATAIAQGENAEASVEGQEFLRWQTRDFAMRLLSTRRHASRSNNHCRRRATR
jgi:HEAT repeat-containing protein 5